MPPSKPRASFVGLATLDILYAVDHLPAEDEKLVALRQETCAGGPATNAAITFSHLGGAASLQTVVGAHPLAAPIKSDLQSFQVKLIDLAKDFPEPPSLSSILSLASNGHRSVVSANATRLPSPDSINREEIARRPLLLLDGHHLPAALAAARHARACGVRTVLDAGSWKPGLQKLLPWLDVVLASSDFRLPKADSDPASLAAALFTYGVHHVAVTQGSAPVLAFSSTGSFALDVPKTKVVDTLGAGDIFHGAFCYSYLDSRWDFRAALEFAIQTASRSCASFGTRAWMTPPAPEG